MTFFTADTFRTVTDGTWIVEPKRECTFAGVGTDTRDDLTGRAFMALRGANHDAHEYLDDAADAGAALLIIDQPRAASQLPAAVPTLHVSDTRVALTELARAYRLVLANTTVIAVTGSTGKTTTKELIHAALSARLSGTRAPRSFNNDIGVPLTLLAASPDDDYVVVEVGMNAPGEIAALSEVVRPDIAVITTIGPAHLERLGSIKAIAAEKQSMLNHLHPYGLAVLTADSELLAPQLSAGQQMIRFGEASEAQLRVTDYGSDDAQNIWWFDVNDEVRFHVPLPGRHNAVNALAAVAIARHLGLSNSAICNGLSRAELPAMRMARELRHGVRFFNDAYNANPQSMEAALASFLEQTTDAERRISVSGDMLELGATAPAWHRRLGERIIELTDRWRLDGAYFIGEQMAEAEDVVARHWCSERVKALSELTPDAIGAIWSVLRPGDAVLLKGSRGMALERVLTNAPLEIPRRATAVA